MTDPEILKQVMEEAKKRVEDWPEWMRSQEPQLSRHQQRQNEERDGGGHEKLSA